MIFPHIVVITVDKLPHLVSVCQMACHQEILLSVKYIVCFYYNNLMLILKGKVELQVITNCLLDLQKTFVVVEGKVSLMFLYHKKNFRHV